MTDQPMTDVLFHGTILTMNPQQPEVEAILVRGEKIAFVGSLADARAQATPNVTDIALGERVLLPGFHDAHVHLTQHGLELSGVNLHDTHTLEDALDAVADAARATPKGDWLRGAGFLLSRYGVDSVSKHDLDKVAPEHPVFLKSKDHHSVWVNSLALAHANVTANTPDPEHGVIVKDRDGQPSGLLLERADVLITRVMPALTDAELLAAAHAAAHDLAKLGITSVHHMAADPTAGYFRALASAASGDDFPLRVWACIAQEKLEHALALGLAGGQGGNRFCVGGAKFFADGALGSLTAWMLEPYAGKTTRGMPVHGPEVLRERVPLAIAAGFSPVIHAIGDAANRAVLDTLETTSNQWQAVSLRPRIEHAQHLHPNDVTRFAELGIIASIQPCHLVFDAASIATLLPERLHHATPNRTLLAQGTVLAFGSDTPVATPDIVNVGLPAACTRRADDGLVIGEEQTLSVSDALYAYTAGAAYAAGWEASTGSLETGKAADMVVLSHDPRETLEHLSVNATMYAGRWTYRTQPHAPST
jgi:predicted amidohydrolase YtcJ